MRWRLSATKQRELPKGVVCRHRFPRYILGNREANDVVGSGSVVQQPNDVVVSRRVVDGHRAFTRQWAGVCIGSAEKLGGGAADRAGLHHTREANREWTYRELQRIMQPDIRESVP
jgi:hypothetical protein